MKRRQADIGAVVVATLELQLARLQRRLVDLLPFAGALVGTPLRRLGSNTWKLANQPRVRVVAGGPLVLVLTLAAAGVTPWIVALAAGEAVVVLGVWLFGLWWLGRLQQRPVIRTEPAPAQSSNGARTRTNRQTKGAATASVRRRK